MLLRLDKEVDTDQGSGRERCLYSGSDQEPGRDTQYKNDRKTSKSQKQKADKQKYRGRQEL